MLLSATLVIGLINPKLFESLGLYATSLSEILLMVFSVSIMAVFLRRDFGKFMNELGLKRQDAPLQVAAGFGVGAVLVATMFGIMALVGGYSIVHSNWPIDFVPSLLLYLLAGFTEELIFRGFIFRTLEKSGGTIFAVIFSSLAFGFAHMLNMPKDASMFYVVYACLLLAFEAGLPLSGAYLLTRSLWLPTGLHWAWNFFEGTVFGAAVSGTDAGPSFLTAKIQGNQYVTGGIFGPEASVPFFVIGVISGLAMLYLSFKKGKFIAAKDTVRVSPTDL